MAGVILKNIVKYFDENEILKSINLEIKDQEFMVLVGPSGCGKTTTLRIIAGLEDCDSGQVLIGDRDVTNVLPKDRDIAMVFQSYALYPHLTVFDNMGFALKLRKRPKDEIKRRVEQASEILGLQDLLKRKPRQLSGGQRQRVALGRAIVRDPKVFLMDEPLSNLDAKLRVQTRGELKKLYERLKTTIVYVTHDQVEAMTLGSRITIMKDGIIQQVDPAIEMYNNPNNTFVAGFIGSPSMNFIHGAIREEEGKFVFHADSFKVWLPDNLYEEFEQLNNDEYILGIRPEDVLDKQSAMYHKKDFNFIKASVEFNEILGSENFLHLKLGQNKFVSKVDPQINPTIGDSIEVAMDLRRMHLFDKTTHQAII